MSLLSDSEAAAKRERRQAQQWLRRHPDEDASLPPTRRLETGETAKAERTDLQAWPFAGDGAGRHRWQLSRGGRMRGGPVSAMSYDAVRVEDSTDHGLDALQAFMDIHALTGYPPRTPAQVELDARMAHVLGYLKPAYRDLLRERYILDGGHTLEEMAEAHGVTRQAIHQRLARALKSLASWWQVAGSDPIEWEAES